MKSEFPTKKKKNRKLWLPRVLALLPSTRVINATRKRNKKAYDRKREKSVDRWM